MLLPITVIKFTDKSTLGFLLTCGDLLLQGLANAVSFFSCLGIAGHFPGPCLVNLSTGQGIAGILINIINYICTLTLYGKDDYACWVYFSITSAILIFALVIVLLAYKNSYFSRTIQGENQAANNIKEISVDDTNQNQSNDEKDGNEEELPKHKKFYELLKETWIVNVMIVLNYIGTFTVYPNAVFKPVFFNNTNGAWGKVSFTTVTLIYNIGDTIGRKCVKFLPFNVNFLIFVGLGRFILFVLLPLNVFVSSKGNFFASGMLRVVVSWADLLLSNELNLKFNELF